MKWVFFLVLLILAIPTPNYAQTDPYELKILVIKQPNLNQSLLTQELEANYASYGSVKLVFDFDSAAMGVIDLALLEVIQPDVLFLDDLFEGDNLLQIAEINAIMSYYLQGHGIVGSHRTTQLPEQAKLATLFGMEDSMLLDPLNISDFSGEIIFSQDSSRHFVYNGIDGTYVSSSKTTLIPNSFNNLWSDDPSLLLDEAEIIGFSSNSFAAIIVNDGTTHRALYMTHHPAENPNLEDLHFLYNSFIWSGNYEAGRPRFPTSSSQNTENSTSRVIIPLQLFPIVASVFAISVLKHRYKRHSP